MPEHPTAVDGFQTFGRGRISAFVTTGVDGASAYTVSSPTDFGENCGAQRGGWDAYAFSPPTRCHHHEGEGKADRSAVAVGPARLENGVPLFLTQLSETLRSESTGAAHSQGAIGSAASRHGSDLLALGFTVSQVVHDYGDICQAVTELAIEQNAPITTDEFKTLNRCLDTAIAEAVTEHARITAESRSTEESERSGHVAHETRDLLNTAILAYQTLKRGTVAINGSTGAVLGRSLMGLRDLVDSTLSDIRIAANQQRRERVSVTPFLNDIAIAGSLHAESADCNSRSSLAIRGGP